MFGTDLAFDLTNPKLGKELLKDARGSLPHLVWLEYLSRHGAERSEVSGWWIDPNDPALDPPIEPQEAVDQARPLLAEVIRHLKSDSPQEALDAARRAFRIVVGGSSLNQRGRGQAASIRHLAVRAWVIRKFNPHPKKPGESTVGLAKLADLLFLKDGKCPRKIRDSDGTIVSTKIRRSKKGSEIRYRLCDASEHRYDSECVKALITAIANLETAMKRDGIPLEPFLTPQ